MFTLQIARFCPCALICMYFYYCDQLTLGQKNAHLSLSLTHTHTHTHSHSLSRHNEFDSDLYPMFALNKPRSPYIPSQTHILLSFSFSLSLFLQFSQFFSLDQIGSSILLSLSKSFNSFLHIAK